MTDKLTHSTSALWIAWLRSFETTLRDVLTCCGIVLACIAAGLLTLRVPEHRAWHRATVRHVGVRHGSKTPGARVFVTLEDGRQIFLNTQAYVAGLKPDATICVHEMRDIIRGSRLYQHALPSMCNAVYTPAP